MFLLVRDALSSPIPSFRFRRQPVNVQGGHTSRLPCECTAPRAPAGSHSCERLRRLRVGWTCTRASGAQVFGGAVSGWDFVGGGVECSVRIWLYLHDERDSAGKEDLCLENVS